MAASKSDSRKMNPSMDELIIRYQNNAEYLRSHGDLLGCLEFIQIAEWLRKYQKIQKIIKDGEDGNE